MKTPLQTLHSHSNISRLWLDLLRSRFSSFSSYSCSLCAPVTFCAKSLSKSPKQQKVPGVVLTSGSCNQITWALTWKAWRVTTHTLIQRGPGITEPCKARTDAYSCWKCGENQADWALSVGGGGRLKETGAKTECFRQRLKRGAAAMDSMRTVMCFLNIGALTSNNNKSNDELMMSRLPSLLLNLSWKC